MTGKSVCPSRQKLHERLEYSRGISLLSGNHCVDLITDYSGFCIVFCRVALLASQHGSAVGFDRGLNQQVEEIWRTSAL